MSRPAKSPDEIKDIAAHVRRVYDLSEADRLALAVELYEGVDTALAVVTGTREQLDAFLFDCPDAEQYGLTLH